MIRLNIKSIQGDNQVECPRCFSYFHKQYLPFHMSACEGA